MKRIKLPVHIAFIMDGNGRWARRRFRPRAFGHRAGVQNMTKVCAHAFKIGVRIVTVFALSTENLSRPKEELDELFELLTLVQTHKVARTPVVLMGCDYWRGLFEWIDDVLRGEGMISDLDPKLVHITDDVEEAVRLATSAISR